jgi:hypothetical protein
MVTSKTQILIKGRRPAPAGPAGLVGAGLAQTGLAGAGLAQAGLAAGSGSCGCSCHAVLAVDLQLLQAELAILRQELADLLASAG